MNSIYQYCQISKQAHHQALQREQQWLSKEQVLVGLMLQIREIHPAMGLRTMYEFYKPESVGRDAFVSIGLKYGFRTKIFKNQTKTTFSSPYSRYRNLLINKTLTNINQLWTSDITYFQVGDSFYYIVFIMDVYSRLIIGYTVANNMKAINNVMALEMAFKTRKQSDFKNQLIHHSDRGGQYISNQYVEMLNNANIQISMCNQVYENAHIERVNGTIKNQYLIHRNITNEQQLQKELKRSVDTYNNNRPHSALNNLTPRAFEQHIKELDESKRLKMAIWTDNQSKLTDSNQCLLQF
jgi:putative transposase